MACGQGGSLDVEPAGESRRDCRGTCQTTCAQNSPRSAEPALSRGYERALKLVNPGNRPLDAVRRSSLRLFGPRTYTDGLPIWEIRDNTTLVPTQVPFVQARSILGFKPLC